MQFRGILGAIGLGFALALPVIGVMIHSTTPNPTKHHLVYEEGGLVGKHLETFTQWARDGDKVIIDGPCLSACTMVIGATKPENICATDLGFLGFHEVIASGRYHKTLTEWQFNMTHPDLIAVLTEKGWDLTDKIDKEVFPEGFVYLQPEELGIQNCSEVEWGSAY